MGVSRLSPPFETHSCSITLKIIIDPPTQLLAGRNGALQVGFPRKGILVAPDREEVGRIATGGGHLAQLRVALDDDRGGEGVLRFSHLVSLNFLAF